MFGINTLRKRVETLNLQLKEQRFFNSFNSFTTQLFPHYKVLKDQLIYQTEDDINSVISKIATTAAKIPFYGEQKDGSEIKPKDKLNDLLKLFNYEFKLKAYTDMLLYGELFLYKEKLEAGVNKGVVKLVQLNPDNIIVFASKGFPSEITGYRFFDPLNGYTKDIAVEDMLFIKFYNPSSDCNESIRGLAPSKVLARRISRLRGNMDTSLAQIQNGGVETIVSDKTPGLSADALGLRKENFARFLNNTSNKGAPYFSSGDMTAIQIGSTLADMNLAELADIDFDKICNQFSVASVLFNNHKSSTYSNIAEARKALITDAVMPLVMMFEDAVNAQVIFDVQTEAIVKSDFSEVEELQADMEKKARALSLVQGITMNEWREAFEYDRIEDDPNMDKPLMSNSVSFVEDLSMPDVADTSGDYTNVISMSAAKLAGK